MRITKVYTRTGDAGQTRLAGGQQVWKDCLRVEAYGTVDELNASVGLVRAMNAESGSASPASSQLEADLRWHATDADVPGPRKCPRGAAE